MPVSDLNATKMGQEAVSIIDTSETVSGFWKLNPEIITYLLVGTIILATFVFLLFYLKTRMEKIIHK